MIRSIILIFLLAIESNALHAQTLPQKKLADTLYTISGLEATKISTEKKELYTQQIQQIQESGLLYSAVNQKSKAPDFTIKNAKGKVFHLSDEIQNGPVILLWYQGGWSAYCNAMLKYFQAYYSTFKKYGAAIVALTPEIPEKISVTKAKNKLTFDVFMDLDNAVAKSYGIAYQLTDTLNKEYETRFQLSKFNENKKGELPLPAAYLVHPSGKIAFAFLNADAKTRAEPSDFLRVLKGMGFPEKK